MGEQTEYFKERHSGNKNVDDQVVEGIYKEIRKIAQNLVGREYYGGPSVSSLSSDAWLRLDKAIEKQELDSRRHFYGIARKTMQDLLVERARRENALKRGGGVPHTRLEDEVDQPNGVVFSDLESRVAAALGEVAEINPQAAAVVEARIICGLSIQHTREYLEDRLEHKAPKAIKKYLDLGKILFAEALGVDPNRLPGYVTEE